MTKDDKAWTFQHMAYFYRDQLEQLEEVRAVVPKAEFRPILYDTSFAHRGATTLF